MPKYQSTPRAASSLRGERVRHINGYEKATGYTIFQLKMSILLYSAQIWSYSVFFFNKNFQNDILENGYL